MDAVADFDTTLTFCFTPEHRGLLAHHTSAPQVSAEFAEFCAAMVERYAGSSRMHAAGPLARPALDLSALAVGS
jgi:beta-xylosidase